MGTVISSWEKLSQQQSKFIKSLHSKKYRQQARVFLVEGTKSIATLLASDYTVQLVVGTASFMATHSPLLHKRGIAAIDVTAQKLTSLSALKTNSTALAVVEMPAVSPPPTALPTRALALDNIRDPGNLGTIIRIADWYGISTLICAEHTVDLYNPKVLQASMGSFAHVKVYYTDLSMYLAQLSVPIVGTFTQGASIHQASLPAHGLVVIGNEAQGISQAVLPHIQHAISIPRYGQAESLNAAIATAIVCDHWQRQHS